MKYYIVHPGQAHRDDYLISTLLSSFNLKGFRKNPTEEELKDPEILVADIGDYNPKLNNWDHHTEKTPSGECSLSLYLKYEYPAFAGWLEKEKFGVPGWLTSVRVLDDQGPQALKEIGGAFPSMLATKVIEAFGKNEGLINPDSWYMQAGIYTWNSLFEDFKQYKKSQEYIKFLPYDKIEDYKITYLPDVEHLGIVQDNFHIVAYPNQRGSGTCIWRENGLSDILNLKEVNNCSFNHKNGFFCVYKETLNLSKLKKIIKDLL